MAGLADVVCIADDTVPFRSGDIDEEAIRDYDNLIQVLQRAREVGLCFNVANLRFKLSECHTVVTSSQIKA